MRFLINLLRGIAILRHNEVVRDLGERRNRLAVINSLRQKFPHSKLHNDITLIGDVLEFLDLGNSTTIGLGTIISTGDGNHPGGRISIGDQTWIGQYNNLRASCGRIVIGSNCLVSQFCTLVANNHGVMRDELIISQSCSKGVVIVKDDVWLGAGVTITPNVTIEQGAVIGAGAVVTKSVPAYEIWGGIPARKIGERH